MSNKLKTEDWQIVQIMHRPLEALLVIGGLLLSQTGWAQSSFDGDWQVVYPCDNTTGLYEGKCKRGERDSFTIFGLTQIGHGICGHHLATAQLGNRVDENGDSENPSIFGRVEGNTAKVKFLSGFSSAEGEAELHLQDGYLYWEITEETNSGQHWLPEKAKLVRLKNSNYKASTCNMSAD